MIVLVLVSLASVLLVIGGTRKLKRSSAHAGRPPFPPGPTPLPLVGNVLGINKDAPHLTYTAWASKYGDIVHAQFFGQDVILLNTERAAVALFEKRSQNYSDRPLFAAEDLFGWDWVTITARYGPRLKLHRRLLHESFHPKAVQNYRERHLRRAYELMMTLLNDPADFATHFATYASYSALGVTYGYDTKGKETFVTSMQRATEIIISVNTPQLSTLCAMFPFVKALPPWFPGMGWKSRAAESRRLVADGMNTPYEWVKRRVAEGNAAPSMVANTIVQQGLDDDAKNPELVRALKESAGSLFSAATGATADTLLIFVYIMMNHPEVQRRAHAEIDRVVGKQRLPDFEDRASLPYVGAILREAMRYQPVVATSLPHAAVEEDVYEGYYIPRGAPIIANVWAMTRNEEKYPNPDTFMPERFLQEDGTLNDDTLPWVFGFGRRICPGRHFADAWMWSAIACMLALFKMEKTEGSDDVKWASGVTYHPLPFPCRIVPRDERMDSERLASLIRGSGIDL